MRQPNVSFLTVDGSQYGSGNFAGCSQVHVWSAPEVRLKAAHGETVGKAVNTRKPRMGRKKKLIRLPIFCRPCRGSGCSCEKPTAVAVGYLRPPLRGFQQDRENFADTSQTRPRFQSKASVYFEAASTGFMSGRWPRREFSSVSKTVARLSDRNSETRPEPRHRAGSSS
jgi:hypothetical protein